GSLPEQALHILNHFGCSTITPRNFFRHQDSYLLPAIFRVWDHYQQAFISQFSSENTALVLGGDGRADSPGHCAKYGSYTLIELNQNIVLDIQLVQKKLLALAKQKDCEVIGDWTKSIINHLYWCAMSSPSNLSSSPDLIRDKWVSVVNHMHNKYCHTGTFKKCA
uniref:Uncharacterized protein n=1 Tax=Amphimedon queenslandica TaxID=400682 RepID=A0A1X7U695_AMPQE